MKRRDFIASLVVAATSRLALAEEPSKTYRIAIAEASWPVAVRQKPTSTIQRVFFAELRRLGYVEGKNLVIGWYSAEGRIERYPEVVLEVIRWNPDVIVGPLNSLVRAFLEVTKSVPIVAFTTDPVREGLAASLARPGGNITGVTTDAGVELMGKYLEILKEAMPSASKFAYLGPAFRWDAERPALLEAARQLGVSLVGILVDSPFKEPELRRAFAAIVQERVDALMVGYAGQFGPSSKLIVELAGQNHLPAIYPYRLYMDVGGLMAYALEIDSLWMQAAHQVDEIFKGAKPGEIPIQQATNISASHQH
jgi:ABC-type uncharacterized transport system substrate-binding protein